MARSVLPPLAPHERRCCVSCAGTKADSGVCEQVFVLGVSSVEPEHIDGRRAIQARALQHARHCVEAHDLAGGALGLAVAQQHQHRPAVRIL